MNKINGLLTQKPTSPVPKCGETHRYSITERVSKKTGKPWTKVKAEGEGYGELYEVLSVEKTDFVDAHGNVSFNIDLAAQEGATEAPPFDETLERVKQQLSEVSDRLDASVERERSMLAQLERPEARPENPSYAEVLSKPVTVRSTSSNGATASCSSMEQSLQKAVAILDAQLTSLIEAATPDARLDAVLRVALSLFIQSHR